MRTSILAMIVALGTTISMPAMAQQQTGPSQQLQNEADQGVKTRNSGESGYVGLEEKPGASTHAPGQPASNSDQTTGSSSGASSTLGSEAVKKMNEDERQKVDTKGK